MSSNKQNYPHSLTKMRVVSAKYGKLLCYGWVRRRIGQFIYKAIRGAEMCPFVIVSIPLNRSEKFDAFRFQLCPRRNDIIHQKPGDRMGHELVLKLLRTKYFEQISVWQFIHRKPRLEQSL